MCILFVSNDPMRTLTSTRCSSLLSPEEGSSGSESEDAAPFEVCKCLACPKVSPHPLKLPNLHATRRTRGSCRRVAVGGSGLCTSRSSAPAAMLDQRFLSARCARDLCCQWICNECWICKTGLPVPMLVEARGLLSLGVNGAQRAARMHAGRSFGCRGNNFISHGCSIVDKLSRPGTT